MTSPPRPPENVTSGMNGRPRPKEWGMEAISTTVGDYEVKS